MIQKTKTDKTGADGDVAIADLFGRRVRICQPESMFDGRIGRVTTACGSSVWVDFEEGGGGFAAREVEVVPNVERRHATNDSK